MKKNLNAHIYRIIRNLFCNCLALTESVLWNLIDLLDAPEYWWNCLEAYGAERCRGDIFAEAVMELGLLQTLHTVAECYRFQIA